MSMDDDDDENLTPEEHAFAAMVQDNMNLFLLPEPPEHLTPRMAQIALKRLITLSQQLGQETMHVMIGVHQLDPALGQEMVGWIPTYFGGFQDAVKDLMDEIDKIGF